MSLDNINGQNSENVTINNIDTSVIIEDASDVLSYFADKYIITKYPIKTGDIVEYAGIMYIVVSQIDRNIENRKENQYNYRARIRQADFTIKMVVGGKVETFSSIIEGQTFDIVEGKIMDMSSDKIIVTIKADDISNKISKTMRFIKMGGVWKVVGIDKSKLGLIILFCDSDSPSHLDDVENEIANTNLIKEPIDPEIPEEPTGNITYTITVQTPYQDDDPNELWYGETYKYIVHKFIDGIEVVGSFTFELSDTSKATVLNVTNNSCDVNAKNVLGNSTIKLIITDADTNKVAIEKTINIKGK